MHLNLVRTCLLRHLHTLLPPGVYLPVVQLDIGDRSPATILTLLPP